MQIIQTAELTPEALAKLDFDKQYAIYNGLDSLMTSDIAQKLRPTEGTPEEHMYYFERALLPVALAMSKKGVLVDADYKKVALDKLTAQAEALNALANKVAQIIWGKDVNIRSSVQLKKIFFEVLDIPKQFKRVKGETKVSTDYNALERIARDYVRGRFFAKIVLKIRDVEKLKGALETKLTPEHRWHSSFNIAGTETTRFSSSPDAFGYGANQQNITEELRRIFIPDPGKILAYTDLKGAESMFVAYETGDENYIKAADSGDSHTLIASKLFGIPAVKDEAEKVYSHGRSYRDISKASQHACVTPGHEVLTKNGWVKVEDYDGTTPIAVWDEQVQFESPSRWNVHDYSGVVFNFVGDAYSQQVTPVHKFKVYEKGASYEVEARKLAFRKSGSLPYVGWYVGGTTHLPEALVRLIAAYQADGYYHRNFVGFHLKKKRKIERLTSLLAQAGFGYRTRPVGDTVYIILDRNCSDEVAAFGKQAGAYLLDWSVGNLEWFIDELPHWDGHIRTSNGVRTSISTKNKAHAEWLQTILQLCGRGSKLRGQLQKSGYNPEPWICYEVSINKRKFASVESLTRTYEDYTGKVYCPTVSTGYFMVRHDGHISVCGNSNYGGTPFAIAMQKNVPVRLVEEFQKGYFKEYPGIRDWQNYIIEQLQTTGTVMTSTGVKRTFWGRLRDDDTIKQALAFRPQAGIAHVMNMGMVRVHYGVPEIDLLMQVHDAVVFQMDEKRVDELLPKVISLLEVPLDITDIKGKTRRMKIPVEANIGYNWSKFDPKKKLFEDGNPLGMREWKPGLADELRRLKYST